MSNIPATGSVTIYATEDKVVIRPASASAGVQSVTGDGVGGTAADVVLTFPTAGEIGAIPASEKGAANGVATLDADGRVVEASVNDRFGFALQAGRYYSNFMVGTQQANRSEAALYYFPFSVINAGSIDRIGIGIALAGSAGAVVRLGIYASNEFGRPSNLIIDAGTIDGTILGANEITLSPALSLPVGRYFLACVTQGGAATRPRLYLSQTWNDPSVSVQNNAAGGGGQYVGFLEGGITGALPVTPGIVNVINLSIQMYVRAS